jgi:hypothetical protein
MIESTTLPVALMLRSSTTARTSIAFLHLILFAEAFFSLFFDSFCSEEAL